jgi:D-alanyl-D-alanine carboxypeptidase (penicillin-binding protein 5/6)
MKKTLSYLAKRFSTCLILASSLSVGAQASPSLIPSPPALAATAYILIDAQSGEVLVENNADKKLPPASLTKMMTSYILSYELAEGNVKKSDMVMVSKNAWAQNFPGSSLMWIEVGKEVELADLHRGVIISSGNDASVAVAEHLAGSESAFADIMNQHAQLLGMEHTHYVNAHGLPHPDHYTTPRDLSLLAKAIIYGFPDDYAIYKEKEFTYNNIRQTNRNTLMWRDPSVDGLKTGHTEEAGYCLVASAEKNGMRLISVVMGTKSKGARRQETQKLLSYGFRYFESYKLYDAGEVLNTSKVWAGQLDTVELGITEGIHLTVPRGKAGEVKAEMQIDDIIKAPVIKGQELGQVVFTLSGETLYSAPLRAMSSVNEAGLISRLWDDLVLFFKSLFSFE